MYQSYINNCKKKEYELMQMFPSYLQNKLNFILIFSHQDNVICLDTLIILNK